MIVPLQSISRTRTERTLHCALMVPDVLPETLTVSGPQVVTGRHRAPSPVDVSVALMAWRVSLVFSQCLTQDRPGPEGVCPAVTLYRDVASVCPCQRRVLSCLHVLLELLQTAKVLSRGLSRAETGKVDEHEAVLRPCTAQLESHISREFANSSPHALAITFRFHVDLNIAWRRRRQPEPLSPGKVFNVSAWLEPNIASRDQ
ncbi:hypothetical protein EGW08_011407 [Elysia chlorotica]|uniref:Uncharacterized protein n=1 Tax=Elysia chlorotica TaxID=188477 RepID=A0A433TH34_ELYCH|nr:hypothetical protein EGW08_011407 [Elysia chlorotica]